VDGFSWNLVFEYSKTYRENSCFVKNSTRIMGTLHEDVFTFMTISRWILLRKRNVSNKSCRETPSFIKIRQ
jgi:hypothetical protein